MPTLGGGFKRDRFYNGEFGGWTFFDRMSFAYTTACAKESAILGKQTVYTRR